jgi:hypothetical protein
VRYPAQESKDEGEHGRMRRMVWIALLALIVVSAGCGSNSAKKSPPKADSPSIAQVKKMSIDMMRASSNKDYRKVWSYFYSGYRSLTTYSFWRSCMPKVPKKSGVKWTSFKIETAAPMTMKLPLLGNTTIEDVTVNTTIEYKGKSASEPFNIYWVKVDGRWQSLWSPDEVNAYKAHRCP